MEELELISKYQQFGDKKALDELLKKYQPAINSSISASRTSMIPSPLLQTEAELLAANAFKTYNPDIGPLPPHVKSSLKPLMRIVNRANPLYIPESRAYRYSKYQQVKADQRNKLRREPTVSEMADAMMMNINDIARLEEETKRKLIHEKEPSTLFEGSFAPALDEDKLILYVHGKIIDPQEKKVMEYVFGINGERMLSSNREIAKKLNISESGVRRIKDKVISAIRKYQ